MADKSAYQTKVDAKNLQLAKAVLKELPSYANDYINSKYSSASTRTLLQYAYSLRKFFAWLQSAVPHLANTTLKDISRDELGLLTSRDLEEFMMFLQTDPDSKNSRASVAQKIAAVGSMFQYLHKNGYVAANPVTLVERPKLTKDNRIIYLTDEECVRLLNAIEFGSSDIPPHQLKYLESTRQRDLAIATLMLDTGIRLSECVGLNVEDINFDEAKIQVYRKGGKYQYLPINGEVIGVLKDYMEARKKIVVDDKESKSALFLSMQRRRMTNTAMENVIKKYAKLARIDKPITPHKLRKTYGTALYHRTKDIYLTANALGHESVATTSRHYVNDTEDSLREVVESMKIRQNATD